MQLPTVEDINSTRLSRFDDAITTALEQADRISAFRDIIGHYVEHHDVPEADVAAALAVVAQGDEPLLLSPDDVLKLPAERDERRGRGERGDRPERGDRSRPAGRRDRGERTAALAQYRIEVGKRQRVEPRQIVGALANEGGLSRDDFGAIKIFPDFSLVELPAELGGETLRRFEDTRIGGRLIELKPDRGRKPRAPRHG
jgi:ATP-dependent RNA helicase DeaD